MKIINGKTEENVNADALATIARKTVVAHAANTYTLNLQNAAIKNFEITSADANAKTIAFDNVDTSLGLIQVCVHLICTTAAAFTHPAGATFAAGAPTFTTGQSYDLAYISWDGGTTWEAFSVRGA
jgi:hypothetical protein